MPMIALQNILCKKTLKGFSLGETLLGAFILTTALTAVTALLASSYRHATESGDVIIAAELAQEGVELVRNVRDNDFASGGNGFSAFNSNRHHCRIDYNDPLGSLTCYATQGNLTRYNLQYGSGMYRHAGNVRERFSRYIYVDYNGSDKANVRSFVIWGNRSLPPSTGTPNGCSIANKCVFTEAVLVGWKE